MERAVHVSYGSGAGTDPGHAASRQVGVRHWEGHGRAGTICAILLGRLYSIGAEEALRRVQLYHDTRLRPECFLSPAAAVQGAQD